MTPRDEYGGTGWSREAREDVADGTLLGLVIGGCMVVAGVMSAVVTLIVKSWLFGSLG